jgi:hypothetical protein
VWRLWRALLDVEVNGTAGTGNRQSGSTASVAYTGSGPKLFHQAIEKCHAIGGFRVSVGRKWNVGYQKIFGPETRKLAGKPFEALQQQTCAHQQE